MERSPNLDFNLNLHYIKKREIFPQNLSMKASSKAWFQQFSFKITKPNNKFGSEKWGSMKFLVMAIGDGGSRRWWCLWEAILVKEIEAEKIFFGCLLFFSKSDWPETFGCLIYFFFKSDWPQVYFFSFSCHKWKDLNQVNAVQFFNRMTKF